MRVLDGVQEGGTIVFIAFARVVALAIALLPLSIAQAQDKYPSRPVRMIVPFPPGGPSDVITRLLAQKFSERLGQQFYVENHAGRGGNVGTPPAAPAPARRPTVPLGNS